MHQAKRLHLIRGGRLGAGKLGAVKVLQSDQNRECQRAVQGPVT